MTTRGLIVAVETYPLLRNGLTPSLPGTREAADRFRAWLIDQKGAAPADVAYCADDPAAVGRTAGATRADIVGEIHRLQREGKDATAELYVFVSGHGFGYTDADRARVADLFVCADFRERAISGDAVLKLDQLQAYLRLCLGPGDHYYFIDCCRNALTTAEIKPSDLPLAFDQSLLGQPTVYTLYSTQEGLPAGVKSGFGDALVDGLRGNGRAKRWQGASMAVVFESLKEFVRRRLTRQPIDGRVEGDGEGVIVRIDPAPSYRCTIRVSDASPADEFEVAISTIRGQSVGGPLRFAGPMGRFSQVPDDYRVAVTLDGRPLSPAAADADLYDHCDLEFKKRSVGFSDAWRPRTELTIHAPAGAPVRVGLVAAAGDPPEIAPGGTARFAVPGRYQLEVRDRNGAVVRRELVDIGPGETREIDLGRLRSSPLRDALVARLPGDHGGGAVDLGGDLGRLIDPDLDLWLALLGAARIVGGPAAAALRQVPLRSLEGETPGARPVYVLFGADDAEAAPYVGLSGADRPVWTLATPIAGVPDLYEAVFPSSAPGDLVSIKLAGRSIRTVATCRIPGRVTFIAASRERGADLVLQQFLPPLGHRLGGRPAARDPLQATGVLPLTRLLVLASRQVAARRSLASVVPAGDLAAAIDGGWSDPVMATFVAYDLIRRGGARDRADRLAAVLRHLTTSFPELPDGAAAARLAGRDPPPPGRPPLILDGFLGWPPDRRPDPLPGGRLDYRGPWTAWVDAVDRPPD